MASSARVADSGWKRRFDDPIPLPRGRQLVTRMMPIRANIVGLPDVAARIKASIAACHSAVVCSALGSRVMYLPGVHREFDLDRKPHHWGKRKLKRDR
jgi:hypothetical protein